MKILFFLFTAAYSTILTPVHDVPIAMFHITESNDVIQIGITLDLEDFSESLDIKMEEVNLKMIQHYLDQHTSFQFNTQVAKLNISTFKIVRDHIRVKGKFEKVAQKIKTLKVENTCLNNVSSHSNIIQVDLNNETKDYRMHKKRTVINLSY